MKKIIYRRAGIFAFIFVATAMSCCHRGVSPTVVIVNDTPITLAELQRTPEFYDFLEQYITAKMLQAAANEQGISPTREAVEARQRSEIEARFAGDRETYLQWLAERGLTEDDFRQFILRTLRREMLIARHLEPSDEEVRAAFEAEKDYWRQYFSEMLQIPKEQVSDDIILRNLKSQMLFLRRSNSVFVQKILETYRGWATRVVFPNARPLPGRKAVRQSDGGQMPGADRFPDAGTHSNENSRS